MQKLRQDVHTLAEENRSLTCQLKDSMNLVERNKSSYQCSEFIEYVSSNSLLKQ